MRTKVYGSVLLNEGLTHERFEAQKASVLEEIPAERLLVMNVIEGDGWAKPWPFLGLERPERNFPNFGGAEK